MWLNALVSGALALADIYLPYGCFSQYFAVDFLLFPLIYLSTLCCEVATKPSTRWCKAIGHTD